MTYRCGVDSVRRPRARTIASLLLALSLLAAGCGGDDSPDGDIEVSDDESAAVATAEAVETPAVAATQIPIETPTATPVPTATPEPTSTPIPLEAPTPSAILFDAAFTNDSKVTTVGIDEVFFGMLAADAAEAASTVWVGDPVSTSNCYTVVPEDGPEGIELWIVDGHVERVDIRHPDLRTPSTLGVGNTLEELQSQLGERLTDETTDDGTVVATFTPSDAGDRDFRIIFELVDDRVTTYRSGRVGVVDRAVC